MRARRRVSAVRFLNTSPLVWGLLHGPQRGIFDVHFSLPSECAEELRTGEADIGLVPAIELASQPDLIVLPGCSVACRGAVRSILFFSRKPIEEVESIAADAGSRTAVVLAQIWLARKFGLRPRVRPYPPQLDEMLERADAALIIGDPALHLDPGLSEWRGRPLFVHDLGAEWVEMTGLPMVFAVWAVKNLAADPDDPAVFQASAAYGFAHIDEIVRREGVERGYPADLARRYLTENISYEFGAAEQSSLEYFLRAASDLGLAPPMPVPSYLEAVAADQAL
ncbi:MAG: menaquinone biosynthesis protein [Bryobacterales bacterium]|nr:menaquinone biosynthesis protein [Bryobacterales bacterium]